MHSLHMCFCHQAVFLLSCDAVALYYVFCRKNFCGYTRVDVDVNYTTYVSHEQDAKSHYEGMFSELIYIVFQ